MTETVRAWRDYGPDILPLPHPSWRNTAWLSRNPWFEAEVLPYLQARVRDILSPAHPREGGDPDWLTSRLDRDGCASGFPPPRE